MQDDGGRGVVHQKMMDDYDKDGWLDLGLRYTSFLMNRGGKDIFFAQECEN